MQEECAVVRTREGYLVNSCTGEVLDFEGYDAVDYSNLEYYERAQAAQKARRRTGEVRNLKKVVLNYLLSIMTEDEKEKFYRILDEIERYRKADAAMYLAIYEYVLEREGKMVSRDYLDFLKAKGIGPYSVRQRKKLLRQALHEDPVIHYINNEYEGDREEALLVYNLLKENGLLDGKAKKRKEILLEYLNDKEKKRRLLTRYYVEQYFLYDVPRTLSLLVC